MEALFLFGLFAAGLAAAGVFTSDHDADDDVEITGTDEDETIVGGSGDDLLQGLGGDDTVLGDGGDDWIDGGSGDDTLGGGTGDDSILGGFGDDRIWGNDGDDIIAAGAGDDRVFGGDGDDLIEGWHGEDTLLGQDGDDILLGVNLDAQGMVMDDEFDNDTLRGGEGDDLLIIGSGDVAYGDEGADNFLTGTYVSGGDAPQINDWEDGEDMLTIVVDSGAPGLVSISESPSSDGTAQVFVDGVMVAQVAGAYGAIGLEDITVLEEAA